MDRRDLLRGVAAAAPLAGCLEFGSSASTRDGRVTVSADVPADLDVVVEPAVLTEPVEESPTRIRLTLRNTARRTRTFNFGVPAPFQGGSARTDGTELLFLDDEEAGVNPLPENYYIPDEREGGCWVANHTKLSFNAVGNLKNSLAASESVSNDYVLLATETSDCPVEGTFRFTFEIPLEEAIVRETDDNGYVTNVEYPTWDLVVTFDPSS